MPIIADDARSGLGDRLSKESKLRRFEDEILPHLDAAYNFARWLTGDDQDARDVVQESFVRAFKGFGRFSGDNSRGWLFTIVRNTFYTWFEKNRAHRNTASFEEDIHSFDASATAETTPDVLVAKAADLKQLRVAVAKLPAAYREVIVLREFEDRSYQEIASITGSPIGTVMSRLSRARRHLEKMLMLTQNEEQCR